MRIRKHTSRIVNHPELFARHTSQIRLYVPAVPFGMPQSGTDEQLRRRRRQQLTSFDFTDRPTRLYRNIRSIRYIYSKHSGPIRAKHIMEQGLPIHLESESLARRNRQRSCLLCCTLRNSIVRQKHPTSSVRSCLNEENARKRRAKKKVHDEVGIPRFCTREERDMGNLP